MLFLQAGPEIAVVATKTFVDPGHDAACSLAAQVRQGRGRLAAADERQLVAGLRALPSRLRGRASSR